jgi:hypothetical protein
MHRARPSGYVPQHIIPSRYSFRSQRFVKKADERARRVRLTVTAPLPDEWRRLCKEIGIYLDPAVVKGSALVDGKDEVDEALAELGGRWLS